MDNDDGAFATDAAIDAAIRNRSPNKAKPRASTDSAAGRYSVDDSRVNSSEDTPLLVSGDEGGSISDGEENVEEDPFASLPWWKRPSIYWILPIFLLATLAFGGVLIPQLNLILELVCRNYISEQSAANPNFSMAPVVFGQENPQCRTDAVQKRVAQFTLACNVISGLLSAITSPKFGALSDRFGRNKLIALCSTGALFREIMMICAARNPDTFPVSLLLIGYALDGLCGSFTALMAIVHSYATDVTTSANRNSAFGYFHGCLFAGIALGPLFAAFVIERTHTVISIFYIAFAVHIFYILFFVFIIPESVSKARQQAAREKYQEERASYGPAADWISHIRSVNILEPLKILYPTGPGSSPALRRNLILLSAVDAIVFGVAIGAMTVIVIYVNYQFGWDTVTTSKFTSLVNVTRVFCLLCIFPLVTWIYKRRRRNQPAAGEEEKHRGMNMLDLGVIRVAVFFDTIGLLGYSLARTPALFALSGCLAAVGGIGSPALQSALTKHVPPDRTGQILGANGLLHALARVWGPMIFNGIYSLTVGKYTQTVFVCLTATFFVAFICTWFVRPNVYLDESPVAAEAAHNDEAIRRLLGSARLSQEPADVS